MSDSHHQHADPPLPEGDIFVHCGDFTHKSDWKDTKDIPNSVKTFNDWLGTLNFEHKIVIAGNHEIGFTDLGKKAIQEKLITNAHYLQDSGIELMGIKFYGSPWTRSRHMGFSASDERIQRKWARIPKGIDVLLTHQPPHAILDLAWVGGSRKEAETCQACGKKHGAHSHWGCIHLAKQVPIVAPKVHVFGHVHDCPGVLHKDNITYINGTTALSTKVIYFDWYEQPKEKKFFFF